MSVLPIITFPDPILQSPCRSISQITPDIKKLIFDMQQTMQHYPRCVGLAAPQINQLLQIIVINASLHPKPTPNHGLLILINPVIVAAEGKRLSREGCLSIPELTGNVTRAEKIFIEAVNENGTLIKIDANGFEATVLQHEIDHINGILFLDRVTSLKTDIFRRKQ